MTARSDHALLRHRMVQEQIRRRGVVDEGVLAAMEKVPRHLFIPRARRHRAYEDAPLPVGLEQTISQPYMVACMTELLALTKKSRVLEVGTGTGYQAAVLAELAGEVFTIERLPGLGRRAAELLHRLGYDNIRTLYGDGTAGFPEAAPYDAIVVTAAAPRVPEALREQLTTGGRMVIPVAAGHSQELLLIERLASPAASGGQTGPRQATDAYRETKVLRCVFVPLIGADGYDE